MPARRLLAHLGLVCASLAFALLVMEGALRLLYPAPLHFRFPQEFYDFDPEIAHVLRPGQASYTHHHPVSVNSRGLRDAEVPERPAPGVIRVLALGDSQTFGNGLAHEEAWPEQLEQALNRAPGVRWELLNAGIPGTDTWQHEILLGRLWEAYHPHAVVLAFYVNDVSPRYEPRPHDAADKTNTWKKRLVYWAKRSALVTLLHQRMLLLHRGDELEQGRAFSEYILAGEPDPRVESGWQQVEQSLAGMKAFCGERGIPFLLAVLPRRDQVSGANAGRAYNRRLAEIAARHDIPHLDLLPALTSAHEEHGPELFIPWDGHNSALANRLIAQQLALRLRGLGSGLARR